MNSLSPTIIVIYAQFSRKVCFLLDSLHHVVTLLRRVHSYGSLTRTVVEILHEPITRRGNLNWRTGFIFALRAIDNFQRNCNTLQDSQVRRSNY